MGILNCWRQFGKRYFWPHLLLGVVAAGIGVPALLANISQQTLTHLNTASVVEHQLNIERGLWQARVAQSSSINPWQQYAIKRFLTRLAIEVNAQNKAVKQQAQNRPLLSLGDLSLVDSLVDLLAVKRIAVVYQNTTYSFEFSHQAMGQTGLWLTHLGGLRAGPISISSLV